MRNAGRMAFWVILATCVTHGSSLWNLPDRSCIHSQIQINTSSSEPNGTELILKRRVGRGQKESSSYLMGGSEVMRSVYLLIASTQSLPSTISVFFWRIFSFWDCCWTNSMITWKKKRIISSIRRKWILKKLLACVVTSGKRRLAGTCKTYRTAPFSFKPWPIRRVSPHKFCRFPLWYTPGDCPTARTRRRPADWISSISDRTVTHLFVIIEQIVKTVDLIIFLCYQLKQMSSWEMCWLGDLVGTRCKVSVVEHVEIAHSERFLKLLLSCRVHSHDTFLKRLYFSQLSPVLSSQWSPGTCRRSPCILLEFSRIWTWHWCLYRFLLLLSRAETVSSTISIYITHCHTLLTFFSFITYYQTSKKGAEDCKNEVVHCFGVQCLLPFEAFIVNPRTGYRTEKRERHDVLVLDSCRPEHIWSLVSLWRQHLLLRLPCWKRKEWRFTRKTVDFENIHCDF